MNARDPSRNIADEASIERVFLLTRRMKRMADRGEHSASDDGCRLLFCIVRDCAFKIEHWARQECLRHQPPGNPRKRSGANDR